MLYVFHVDSGLMTTYDMKHTLESVSALKIAIERKTRVPANSVVLLVSGGEVLHSDHKVSSYSAGTDTNPIYMFSKPSVKESHIKQSMCDLSPIVEVSTGETSSDMRSGFDGKSIVELKNAVDNCCSMGPTANTVLTCATLAQQFSDLAREVSRSCDQLVHEQHLQHQGWAAVVANLEDIFNEFNERSRSFKESYRKHRLKKEEYHKKLNTLNEVLESLGRIPILPALQLNAEAHRFSAFDVFEDTEFEGHHYGVNQSSNNSSKTRTQDLGGAIFKLSEEDVFERNESRNEGRPEAKQQIDDSDESVMLKESASESKDEPSLLHWILAQGNKASLQDILDYCQKGLALIDAEPLKEREAELYQILEYANMHGIMQIKGIEDRLYGLDQLLNDVKKTERDQHDQAKSLIQCKERLNVMCDASVLTTLVQSHWCQLEKLLWGHQSLVDFRRRISKSKEELSHILKARLQAVLMIENSMSVQDAHGMLTYQCFNRLARYFGIVDQLHRAPDAFVRAVHEVARRRSFSQAHLQWAAEIAQKLNQIHDEEVTRRQEFNDHFEKHFLNSLFPGMSDMPSQFATQSPAAFDAKLPLLTDEDVEFISKSFPELSSEVPKYDMEATVKFFQHRLDVSKHEEKDVDVQVDFDKDFESETENDFERLSRQSGGAQKQKMDMSTTCAPETMTVSTVTEDNMDTHKINIQNLQEFLIKISNLCRVNILYIKEELVKLKCEIDEQKKFIYKKYIELTEAWQRNVAETEVRFREQTQRLTVDHELEMSDIKAALNGKDEVICGLHNEIEKLKMLHLAEIDRIRNENTSTKDSLEKAREEFKSFEKKFEELECAKQKEISEMREKMHKEYKAEIESLRSRYRIVALTNNMDRSPSESSLEKIERTDVIEISNHNAIVMQTKENAEVEKEEAIKEAVRKCKEDCEHKLTAEVALLKSKYDVDKQVTINDVTRRLLSEKDRQLEMLKERELVLTRECNKYRDTIQQLTDPETNDYDSLLKTQFSTLENEKAALQQQLTQLKKDLEKKSEDKGDADKRGDRARRSRCHTPLGLEGGSLSLSSCLPGHCVMLLWDPAHLNYTVMQESNLMYFVNSDCLPALDLSINVRHESERKLYAIAIVESKEFCYAKKNGNRYHMPFGARFYRVRVRPLPKPLEYPPCCVNRHKQDAMKGSVLSVLTKRPLKKWLTYMHAPDMRKSVDTSQSTSSNTEEALGVAEVATATLINLDSPVSTSESGAVGGLAPIPSEDQLDSIESSEPWQGAKMVASTISAITDMESSVARCPGPEPLELAVSLQAVIARGADLPGSELAEEASP